MANEFDIKELTAQAHGFVGLPFPLLGFDNFNPLPDLNKIGNAVIGKDAIGRSFFMDVVIDGVRLPNEPLVTINTQKRIVETVVVGSERRGTVKELISSNDYVIKIQGICIEPNVKEYPTKQVKELIELCKKPQTLTFENEFAELFGVYNVVVKSYAFPSMKGKPYSQAYTITAVSDEDFFANLDNDLNGL